MNYGLPNDIDEATIDAMIEELKNDDPETFAMVKLFGDRGVHVFAAGQWLGHQLRDKNWNEDDIKQCCFDSGRIMVMASDPWTIAKDCVNSADQR